MTPADIRRTRLAGQFLTTRGPSRPVEVVRALGAMQAQDYAGAKWALGQRTRSATDSVIERALDAGEILRTHVLRPTWHFVTGEDIRWMLDLTGPRVSAMMAPVNNRLGLDAAIVRKSNVVFEKVLAGGNSLTRAELRTSLEDAGITVGTGQRIGHLVMQAELDGLLCSGPRRGKQFTYALLDERSPHAKRLTRDEALLELTSRYFATRGPATARDFAWWSGLTIADAKRGIGLAGARLECMTMENVPYWRAAARGRARSVSSAHLLPNYDEYFIGFRDRSAIAARTGSTKPVMVTNALVPHVIIVNGELVGTWKRSLESDRIVVTAEYLTRLTSDETRNVRDAANAFGRFLERPVEIQEKRVGSRR